MGLFKKIASIFGIFKDENHDDPDGRDGDDAVNTRRPSKGFGVKVPVTVERAPPIPVITECDLGEGGVQGFKWYAKRLQVDEDGDVAEEFLDEMLPEGPCQVSMDGPQSQPKFVLRCSVRPAKVKNQAIALDGNIHQSVDLNGRLTWV